MIGSDTVQQNLADLISENLEFSSIDVTLELTSDGRTALAEQYGEEAVAAVDAELARLAADEESRGELSELADDVVDGQPVTIAGYEVPSDAIEVHYDNIVLDTIAGVVNASGPLTLVSFLVLGYAATGLFSAVRRSLNFVWGFPTPPPFIKGKIKDVALLLMLLTFVVLFLVVLLTLSVAATVLFNVLEPIQFGGQLDALLWGVVQFLVPLALSFALFLVLYRFGPRAHNRLGDVWPGALFAAVGFEALKFGYAIYATNFSSYDVVYGALGGVLLFMFFTYIAAYIFLLGAELASEFRGVITGLHDEDPIPPLDMLNTVVARARGLIGKGS